MKIRLVESEALKLKDLAEAVANASMAVAAAGMSSVPDPERLYRLAEEQNGTVQALYAALRGPLEAMEAEVSS